MIAHYNLKFIIVLAIIAVSGFPFFTTGFVGTFTLLCFAILLTLRYQSYLIFLEPKILICLIGFISLTIIQYAVLSKYNINSFLALISLIILVIIFNEFVRDDFYFFYVKILKFFCKISLFFYFLFYLIPSSYDFVLTYIAPIFNRDSSIRGYDYSKNIILYTFNTNDPSVGNIYDYRNPGPFWEAGAFGLFINLALYFNIFFLKRRIHDSTNIIFIITLFTTFSTASYLLLFFLICGYYLFILRTYVIAKIFLIGLFIFSCLGLYGSLPFLEEKLKERNVSYTEAIQKTDKQERIGTFYFDLEYLLENPFIGYGNDPKNMIKDFKEWDVDTTHKNNGLSNLLLILGVPFGIFYFYRLSKLGFTRRITLEINKSFAVYSFLFFVLFSFSQVIMLTPVICYIFMLTFVPVGNRDTYKIG